MIDMNFKTKGEMRAYCRNVRKNIADRQTKDKLIFDNLFNLVSKFDDVNTYLCYCSTDDEVDTRKIISKFFELKKTVAVPYCVNGDGLMDFYIIDSFDDLSAGMYNILEPDIAKCKKLTNFDNSIIIVPGMCFDKSCNRLGYGKGYYDRFLQKSSLISIGLCYNNLIVENVIVDAYDKKVNYIVTEESIIINQGDKKNGQY
jgi:5-formyltetrahydrofolate cyclo-ligase